MLICFQKGGVLNKPYDLSFPAIAFCFKQVAGLYIRLHFMTNNHCLDFLAVACLFKQVAGLYIRLHFMINIIVWAFLQLHFISKLMRGIKFN
ncbi:hypothetical protein BPO_1521 [Bergeyella porcorum]|uniref:Uncharacterized protein n=1 Tax=Bergeyella porcorum TaxID=1735111 RepID=A0AAU0F2Y3_9FLAO